MAARVITARVAVAIAAVCPISESVVRWMTRCIECSVGWSMSRIGIAVRGSAWCRVCRAADRAESGVRGGATGCTEACFCGVDASRGADLTRATSQRKDSAGGCSCTLPNTAIAPSMMRLWTMKEQDHPSILCRRAPDRGGLSDPRPSLCMVQLMCIEEVNHLAAPCSAPSL